MNIILLDGVVEGGGGGGVVGNIYLLELEARYKLYR